MGASGVECRTDMAPHPGDQGQAQTGPLISHDVARIRAVTFHESRWEAAMSEVKRFTETPPMLLADPFPGRRVPPRCPSRRHRHAHEDSRLRRTFGPGDLLRAEDTEGTGHVTGPVGDPPIEALYVPGQTLRLGLSPERHEERLCHRRSPRCSGIRL